MPSLTLDDLAEAYARVSAQNREALDQFVEIGTVLQQQRIGFLILKGADLLSRLYGAGGLRPMTDIDLLVHDADLPRLDRVLIDRGYRQEIDGNPVYRSANGKLLLDITTTIWYLDQQGLEDIWQRAIQRTIRTLSVRCLHTNDLTLHLIAYNILHRGSCSPTCAKDLRLLTEREPVDWDVVLKDAVRWSLNIPLYYGLVKASEHEPIAIPPHVLSRLAPASITEQALLQMLRRVATDQPLPNIGHFLLLITRPSGKRLKWMWKSLMPSKEFLRYRYGERGTAQPMRTRLLRLVRLSGQASLLAMRILARICTPSSAPKPFPRSPLNIHSR